MKNFGGQPIASLQGLRAVAFFMVLLGHCAVEGTEGLSGVAVSLFLSYQDLYQIMRMVAKSCLMV